MFEQLEGVAQRYEAIAAQLSDPAVFADAARLQQLMREHKRLSPLVEAWRAWSAACDAEAEAKSLPTWCR